MPLASFLLSSSYRLPTGFDLCQRRTFVKVLCNVGIKDIAVVLCHFQRGVTQQLLKRKGISAAVHQILPGESMAEQVRSRLRHPSALVVTGDSLTQGTFCKLFAALIAEKVILRRPAAYLLIFPQDRHHLAAKRDDLNFLVFVVAGDNPMLLQIHITVFDGSDGSRTTAGVQQKVDNDPSTVDREAAGGGRSLQQPKKVFVCVGFLDGFLWLEFGHLHITILLPPAPVQKSGRDPHIAGNGVGCKPGFPHGNHHFIHLVPRELSKRRGNVEVVRNIAEMGAVGLQCFFSKAAGGGVSQKDVKCFFKGDFFCCGTCCGHLNSCHVSVLLILQIPAKNQEVTRLLKTRKNPWKRLVSKDLVETTGLEPVTSCV